jgi:hypothetical protein
VPTAIVAKDPMVPRMEIELGLSDRWSMVRNDIGYECEERFSKSSASQVMVHLKNGEDLLDIEKVSAHVVLDYTQ